jgi:hypothetical protein
MSLFIHPENQELLWNIVNQNPYLVSMLSNQSVEQKQKWFKSIIESFYNLNAHRNLDKIQLNQLNKDTLSYMIQNIRVAPPIDNNYLYDRNNRTVNTFIDNNKKPIEQPNKQPNIPTPPMVPDNRSELFNRQFQERQREYENMLEKKAPEEVNFSEKLEDGVISNMDELIKRQILEREAEYKLYSPPPIINNVSNTHLEQVIPKQNNIEYEINENKKQQQDKQVFQENSIENNLIKHFNANFNEHKKEIDSLKDMFTDLIKTVKIMSNDIVELKSKFDFDRIESPKTKDDVTEKLESMEPVV